MSRRRQDRRDKERELARQLGEGAGEAPDDLRARQRVTRVELKLSSVLVERAPVRLLGRAPVAVEGAVALIEHQAARWVTGVLATSSFGEKKGETAALSEATATLDDDGRVRYARPASFVVFLAIAPGDVPPLVALDPAGVRLRLSDDAADVELHGKALLHRPPARAWEAVLLGEGQVRPVTVLVFPGVHRLREELTVPVSSGKSRWLVTGRLEA